MEFRKAGVIGAGAWGTALAQVTGWAGLDTLLQAREPEVVESIRERRVNEAFLPGVTLDDHVAVTPDLADLAGCDLILAVPPAQHLRATMMAFAPHYRPGTPIVLCAKGIERGSLKLMTEVAAETLPGVSIAVLSGPSFAGEVARGLPAAGYIVQRFGEADDDSGLASRGIRIEGEPGGVVTAPRAGEVRFTGPFKGFGNLVIIETSNGDFTLLGGLGRTAVREGEKLGKGDPVGTLSASTRGSPTLYYELRHGGEPVDPLKLF